MTIAVRYHSRSGNTEKVARAIAEEIGVEANDMSSPLSERVDILFLGSALYAGGVDSAVKQFLRENGDKIGTVYNFSTAASASSTHKQIKKLATERGFELADAEFQCNGKFLLFHKNRPNEEDLKNARQFARSVLLTYQK